MVNAAAYGLSVLAPGEIVSMFGQNLPPIPQSHSTAHLSFRFRLLCSTSSQGLAGNSRRMALMRRCFRRPRRQDWLPDLCRWESKFRSGQQAEAIN